MAKKGTTGAKARGETTAARGARDVLASLITKKEASVTDGAIQVIMAIASVTKPPVYAQVNSFDFGFLVESGDDNGQTTR